MSKSSRFHAAEVEARGEMGGGPRDYVRTGLVLFINELCDLLTEEVVDRQSDVAGACNVITDVRGWVEGIGPVRI